jgi:hypothetical protein
LWPLWLDNIFRHYLINRRKAGRREGVGKGRREERKEEGRKEERREGGREGMYESSIHVHTVKPTTVY